MISTVTSRPATLPIDSRNAFIARAASDQIGELQRLFLGGRPVEALLLAKLRRRMQRRHQFVELQRKREARHRYIILRRRPNPDDGHGEFAHRRIGADGSDVAGHVQHIGDP